MYSTKLTVPAFEFVSNAQAAAEADVTSPSRKMSPDDPMSKPLMETSPSQSVDDRPTVIGNTFSSELQTFDGNRPYK